MIDTQEQEEVALSNFTEDAEESSAGVLMQRAVQALEASRLTSDAQAALLVARQFPRDEFAARTRIMSLCQRRKFANKALYTYTRGGTTVRDLNIRVAEALATAWGNIRFGITEIERTDTGSTMKAWAWDLETNAASEIVFEVPHEMKAKGRIKRISDPREVYEYIANMGTRRLRACILRLIPWDVREDAKEMIEKTIISSGGKTMAERVIAMTKAFSDIGIPVPVLEARLGHKLDLVNEEEILDMTGIYRAIADKAARREDFFSLGSGYKEEKTNAINERVKED